MMFMVGLEPSAGAPAFKCQVDLGSVLILHSFKRSGDPKYMEELINPRPHCHIAVRVSTKLTLKAQNKTVPKSHLFSISMMASPCDAHPDSKRWLSCP